MKKPSDKERLDWLTTHWIEAIPFVWRAWASTGAVSILWLRKAIDAAIAAEKAGTKRRTK